MAGESSFRAILDSIIEKYTVYKPTDDIAVMEQFIGKKMNDVRATQIRDLYQQGAIDQDYYQRTCCLDIVCEQQGCTVNGTFYGTGNILYTVTFPQLLTRVGMKNLIFLGNNEQGMIDPMTGKPISFTRMSLSGWESSDHHPLMRGRPVYTMIGNVAYVKNLITPGMRKVCAVALYDNPLSACNYNELTDNYPVPSAHQLEILVLKDIMSTGIKPDLINDASDTPIDPKTLQAQQSRTLKS